MTPEAIHAIEQVLLINSDICTLYEKRGVSREALREVFTLAAIQGSPEMTDEELKDWLNAVVDAQTEWSTLKPHEQAYEKGEDPADEYWGFFSIWRKMIQDECYYKAFPPGEEPTKAPKWYEEFEIQKALDNGTFFKQSEGMAQGIARHLQLAFEKGFSLTKASPSQCVDDQHRGTECKCCHLVKHCCSHHCCCFWTPEEKRAHERKP